MHKITSVVSDQDKQGNYRVTVHGRRRKVLVRERFLRSKDAASFFKFCQGALADQEGVDERA
jgi:hypothetical protein